MTISRKQYGCGCFALSIDDCRNCPACASKGILPSDLLQLKKACAVFPHSTKDIGGCAFLAIRKLVEIDGDSVAATPFGYAVYRHKLQPDLIAAHRTERKRFHAAHQR